MPDPPPGQPGPPDQPGPPGREQVAALIAQVCAELAVPCEQTGPHAFAVTLPGTHRLRTTCHLSVGDHDLRIEAFVMRAPDERREQLWAWLLRRNARLYGVAFAIDAAGDIYLMGRVGLAGLTAGELDRLLGVVLTCADESFNPMLEIGFSSAIRREWAWRTARGEPTTNLAAFRHLAPPPPPA